MNLQLKKNVNDSIGEDAIPDFIQSLQNYSKFSDGNTEYNLTKFERFQFTGTSIIIHPNQGQYLLQQWNFKGKDKVNRDKVTVFIET